MARAGGPKQPATAWQEEKMMNHQDTKDTKEQKPPIAVWI
jgi:hypothetical protein